MSTRSCAGVIGAAAPALCGNQTQSPFISPAVGCPAGLAGKLENAPGPLVFGDRRARGRRRRGRGSGRVGAPGRVAPARRPAADGRGGAPVPVLGGRRPGGGRVVAHRHGDDRGRRRRRLRPASATSWPRGWPSRRAAARGREVPTRPPSPGVDTLLARRSRDDDGIPDHDRSPAGLRRHAWSLLYSRPTPSPRRTPSRWPRGRRTPGRP